MLLKNVPAELLKVSQLNYFALDNVSSYNAYFEIAAFCLLDRSLPAFLEISPKLTSKSLILGMI